MDFSTHLNGLRCELDIPELSRKKVGEEMIGLTSYRLCRNCHQYPETVEHILSGCPKFAQRQCPWNRNDTLKWVLSELLIAC